MSQSPAQMKERKKKFGAWFWLFLMFYADVAETKEKKSEVKVGAVAKRLWSVVVKGGIC